jgi:hypothetical protein
VSNLCLKRKSYGRGAMPGRWLGDPVQQIVSFNEIPLLEIELERLEADRPKKIEIRAA